MLLTPLIFFFTLLPSTLSYTVNSTPFPFTPSLTLNLAYEIRDLEDHTTYFTQEAAPWSLTNGKTSTKVMQCGTAWLLGGPDALQLGSTLQRTYTNLPSHNIIYFSISVWVMDLQGIRDLFSIYFDSVPIGIWTSALLAGTTSTNICGSSAKDFPSVTITGQVPHIATSLVFTIQSLIDPLLSPPSIGFRDVSIMFMNVTLPVMSGCQFTSTLLGGSCMCPTGTYNAGGLTPCQSCYTGCSSCVGSAASQCTSCQAGYSFFGTKCQACDVSCEQCNGTTASSCIRCGTNYFLYQNGTCKSSCSAPFVTWVEGNYQYCDMPCNTTQFFGPQNVCQASCDAPFVQGVTQGVKICSSPCSSSQFYDLNRSTCVPQCTPPLVTGQIGVLNTCQNNTQSTQSTMSSSTTANNNSNADNATQTTQTTSSGTTTQSSSNTSNESNTTQATQTNQSTSSDNTTQSSSNSSNESNTTVTNGTTTSSNNDTSDPSSAGSTNTTSVDPSSNSTNSTGNDNSTSSDPIPSTNDTNNTNTSSSTTDNTNTTNSNPPNNGNITNNNADDNSTATSDNSTDTDPVTGDAGNSTNTDNTNNSTADNNPNADNNTSISNSSNSTGTGTGTGTETAQNSNSNSTNTSTGTDTSNNTASSTPPTSTSDTTATDNNSTENNSDNNNNTVVDSKIDIPSIDHGGVISQMSGGAVVAMTFLSLNDPTALLLMALSDILKYIQYLNINYPHKVIESFESGNSGIVSLDLSVDISMPQSLTNALPNQELPYTYQRKGVKSNFLLNFWDSINSFIIPFALVFILWPLEILVIKSKKNLPIVIMKRLRVMVKWNFILLIFFTKYDDITMFTFLELRYLQLDSFATIFSFLFCLSMVAVGAYQLWKVIKIAKESVKTQIFPVSNKTPVQVVPFAQKWEGFQVVFGGFKNSSFLKQGYIAFSTARTILCYLIVTILYSYPIVQVILVTIMGIAMFVYLVKQRPMKDLFNLIECISYEIVIFLVNICTMILACLDGLGVSAVQVRTNIGDVILLSSLIVDILSIIFLLIGFVNVLIHAYKGRKDKASKGGWLNILMVPYANLGMELEAHHGHDAHNAHHTHSHTGVSDINLEGAKSSDKLLSTASHKTKGSIMFTTNVLSKEDENLTMEAQDHLKDRTATPAPQEHKIISEEEENGLGDNVSFGQQERPSTDNPHRIKRFDRIMEIRKLRLKMENYNLMQSFESDKNNSALDSPGSAELIQKPLGSPLTPNTPKTPQTAGAAKRTSLWSKRASTRQHRDSIQMSEKSELQDSMVLNDKNEDIEQITLPDNPIISVQSINNVQILENNNSNGSKTSQNDSSNSLAGTPKNQSFAQVMWKNIVQSKHFKETHSQTVETLESAQEEEVVVVVEKKPQTPQGRRFLKNVRALRKKKKLTTIIETKLGPGVVVGNQDSVEDHSSSEDSKESEDDNKVMKKEKNKEKDESEQDSGIYQRKGSDVLFSVESSYIGESNLLMVNRIASEGGQSISTFARLHSKLEI